MAVFIAYSVLLFLAMTHHSDAGYCICNSGVSDAQLQKNIDYACGNGADCSQILSNGPCYNPNTLKDHCNYAVNSYYQRKAQAPGSCDFSGTATVSPTAPSGGSGCVYPSGPSNAGTSPPTTNPSTSPPTTTNPSTSPPTTTNPSTSPPTTPTGGTATTPGGAITPPGGGTATTPPGGTGTGTTPTGTAATPTFGLGPSGSGITNSDSIGVALQHDLFTSLAAALLIFGLFYLRV